MTFEEMVRQERRRRGITHKKVKLSVKGKYLLGEAVEAIDEARRCTHKAILSVTEVEREKLYPMYDQLVNLAPKMQELIRK